MATSSAATTIQGLWRIRLARRSVRFRARKVIVKYWDDATDVPYWYNTKTGLSRFVLPAASISIGIRF